MTLSRRILLPGGFVLALGLGVAFAYLGVFDTNELPFFQRLVFWTSTFVVGNATSAMTAPWLFNHVLKNRHPVLPIVAVAAISSVPVTFVLAVFMNGFTRWPWFVWPIQYGYVMTISLIIAGGAWLGLKAAGFMGDAAEADAPLPDPAVKFLGRLPVSYRGAALYAVSSEDHYLRVHTDRGEALILMRLSDALRELDGAAGVQTHRSWWVARDGVADAARDNGKLTLTLKSGAEAPVSRSFAKDVSEQLLGRDG